MILKSEGDKIRHVTGTRERKYTIVAFSQVLQETAVPDDVLQVVAKSLLELCCQQNTGGFQLAS